MLRTTARLVLAGLLAAGTVGQGASADTQQRLDRIERLLESGSLLEMDRTQQQLQREVAELRGEVDLMERELENLRRQQRSLYEDLDTRLREVERSGVAAPPEPAPELPPATPSLDEELAAGEAPESDLLATETPETADEAAAEEAYQRAFDLLQDGRYQAAGSAFQAVLEEHPGTSYAENARYWLGETHYVVRNFDQALEQFEAVAGNPDNSKRPDAILKIGFIHYEQQQWDQARAALERVREEHAGTTVAALAEDRLQQMRDAGR